MRTSSLNPGVRLALRPFATLLAVAVGLPAALLAIICFLHGLSLLWSLGILVAYKTFIVSALCAIVAALARWPREYLLRR